MIGKCYLVFAPTKHTSSHLEHGCGVRSPNNLKRYFLPFLFKIRFAYHVSISSMIYGRPIGIPYGHLSTSPDSFPWPIDDSYILKSQAQPEGQLSVKTFFVHSMRLYYLMDEILERLHKAKGVIDGDLKGFRSKSDGWPLLVDSNSALSYLTIIVQLDGMLLAWHDSLPEQLQFSLDDIAVNKQHPRWLQRQNIVLRLRFLGMRTLLHRQTVLFLVQPDKKYWPQNGAQMWPPLYSDTTANMSIGSSVAVRHFSKPSLSEIILARLSAKTCVLAACLQIESIDLYSPMNLTETWWWDFHCSSNCTIALLFPLIFYSYLQFPLRSLCSDKHSKSRNCRNC